MRERVHCSDAARLRGDDNAATAARVDVWILVELPITWGRDPMTDAALPQPVRAALTNALDLIPRARIVFIRRRVECLGPTRVYVARSSPHLGVASIDVPSIDDVGKLDFRALAETSGVPARPLVLVCTHGQHDSCCGRRGYPLYDAIRKRDELDVWQCSHIGGDRFAANAIVLPWGVYYGPVEPRDADLLAGAVLRDEILLPAYRGRSSLSRPAQFAETFVRRQLGLTALSAVRVHSRENDAEGRFHIHLSDHTGAKHDVVLEQYTSTESARLTCAAKTANAVRQFRVVAYATS